MDHLRQRPLLCWIVVAVAVCVAFRIVVSLAALLLGPLALPSWTPLVVVLGGLVLVARGQQRSR